MSSSSNLMANLALLLFLFGVCVSSSSSSSSGEITTFTNFLKRDNSSNSNSSSSTNSSSNKVSVFYVHDWNTQDLAKALVIKDSILKSRPNVFSVVICDWTTFSRIPDYYSVAKKYTSRVAGEIWGQIESLERGDGGEAKVGTGNVECVGHGLGAHICGQVGKLAKRNEKQIGKIIGLDPTGPYFKDHRSEGLQKGDALSVEAIHTDTRYGLYAQIGDKDTFPLTNNDSATAARFEECEKARLLKRNICFHNAAQEAFLDTLSHPESESQAEAKGARKTRRAKHSMTILTLDVSPSMQKANRIQNTITASKRLINSLPIGYSIGIVIFGGHAVESLPPTNITGPESRAQVVSKLPQITTQIANTSIGAGLAKALEVMSPYLELDGYCPDVILMTDGEENWAPSAVDVQPRFAAATTCSRVHTIALGAEADHVLESLSKSTGGQAHFAGDVGSADKLTQSLIAASSAQFGMKEPKPIQLPAKEVSLSPNSSESASFAIDDGIGANTTFFISAPNPETWNAELIAPNGEVYGNTTYTTEEDLQGLLFKLLEVQPGNWTIKLNSRQEATRRRRSALRKRRAISTGGATDKTAKIFVTTFPTANEGDDGPGAPIRLEAYMSSTILDAKTEKPLKVEAFVSKGYEPIIGALVHAVITSPEGKLERVELWDNGAGADEEKDDGVYSRFVPTNLEPGKRYGVEVTAVSHPNGSTQLGSLSEDPFQAPTLEPLKYPFERQTSAGSFRIAPNFRPPTPKPSPVRDLKVTAVDIANNICTLEWTAPEEESASIQLRMFTLEEANGLILTEKYVVEGSATSLDPGAQQSVKVKIPENMNGKNTSLSDLYFTVRTVGKDGQLSDLSNIAPAELSIVAEPVVEEAGIDKNLLIVIIVLAALLALALIGLAVFLFVRKRRTQYTVRHTKT